MKRIYSFLYNCRIRLFGLAMVGGSIHAAAQQAGSTEVINGYLAIASGCTQASASENLYIGPGTYVVNGTWQVYSKNIWISPDALITGSGTIRLYNPSAAGGTASTSQMDGNNSSNFINANLALHNASDLTLSDLALPSDLTAAGWSTTSSDASLSVGGDLNFAVANGDAVIGNHNMTLSTSATLSGYQEDRFVVTAGTGHLVKQNYTGSFVFPVGMAAGDYTPAQINNAIINTMHVNVTNYDAVNSATFAGAISNKNDGIDRAWNIYANNATGNSTINLQHNDNTEGTEYTDAFCFVTRLIGTKPNTAGDNTSYSYWESNNTAAGTGTGSLTTGPAMATASERNRTYTSFATSATAYTAWYSKASSLLFPLPVTLISFTGKAEGCNKVRLTWHTEAESELLGYDLEHSNNGTSFTRLAFIPAQLSQVNNYSFEASQTNKTSYYRLKIKHADGSVDYSKVIPVSVHCAVAGTQLYPQPFSTGFTITSVEAIKSLQLIDMSGRLVQVSYHRSGNRLQVDGSALPTGVYIVRLIKANGAIEELKAIKK
jgi:hypothetical protein